MQRAHQAVWTFAVLVVGAAAVVYAAMEASDSASHEFGANMDPVVEVSLAVVVTVVIIVGAIGIIQLVRWALATASTGGGARR